MDELNSWYAREMEIADIQNSAVIDAIAETRNHYPDRFSDDDLHIIFCIAENRWKDAIEYIRENFVRRNTDFQK